MREVIAVLRGGPSTEYERSLKSGSAVLEALSREKYDVRDIFISRSGEWHFHGIPATPDRALKGVDLAFNAMHGHFGEDGQTQRLLEKLGVPYTGSGSFASALAFNKHHTKEAVQKLGIKIPYGVVVEQGDPEQLAHQLFRTFPHPAVIKPVMGGGSVGITIADSFHALQHGLESAFELSPKVLVEEFIKGRDASVGVIDHFRGEETYALIPVPQDLSHDEKAVLAEAAKTAHRGLELSHYSVADFVVSKRGIYFLEVNTLPVLHQESILHQALSAVGTKLSDFLDHVLSLARGKR